MLLHRSISGLFIDVNTIKKTWCILSNLRQTCIFLGPNLCYIFHFWARFWYQTGHTKSKYCRIRALESIIQSSGDICFFQRRGLVSCKSLHFFDLMFSLQICLVLHLQELFWFNSHKNVWQNWLLTNQLCFFEFFIEFFIFF